MSSTDPNVPPLGATNDEVAFDEIVPGAVDEAPGTKAKKAKPVKVKPVKVKPVKVKPVKSSTSRGLRKSRSNPEAAGNTAGMSGIEGWMPTISSFDLLGGEYILASRRRLALLIAVGALVVFAAAMLLRVAGTFVALQEQNQALEQARASQTQLTADYAAIAGTSGATLEQILNHVQGKGRSIVNLTTNEVPLAVLVSVLQSAPTGTTITSVDLGGGQEAAANTGTGGPATYPVRVTATVSEQTLIPTLVDTIKAIPGIQSVDASWGGSDGEGTVTLTLQVAASNQQSRELASRFGIDPAVTEDTTDGSQPGQPAPTPTEATP